jgi:hypothetical protein
MTDCLLAKEGRSENAEASASTDLQGRQRYQAMNIIVS